MNADNKQSAFWGVKEEFWFRNVLDFKENSELFESFSVGNWIYLDPETFYTSRKIYKYSMKDFERFLYELQNKNQDVGSRENVLVHVLSILDVAEAKLQMELVRSGQGLIDGRAYISYHTINLWKWFSSYGECDSFSWNDKE